jgi:hypothetical protein
LPKHSLQPPLFISVVNSSSFQTLTFNQAIILLFLFQQFFEPHITQLECSICRNISACVIKAWTSPAYRLQSIRFWNSSQSLAAVPEIPWSPTDQFIITSLYLIMHKPKLRRADKKVLSPLLSICHCVRPDGVRISINLVKDQISIAGTPPPSKRTSLNSQDLCC